MNIKIKALSPISHGAFNDGADMGNIMEFRKMTMIVNGTAMDIPVISGNAVRGKMRRLLAREFFWLGGVQALNDKEKDVLYAIMANGGALGKDQAVSVDANGIRELREKMPLLSVFGAACYKYILQGMFNCGFAVINCAENGKGKLGIGDLMTEIGETHHIDRTMYNTEETGMKPMPYMTEAVCAGAEFDASIEFAPQTTETEKAAVYHGINLITTIGGKSARGYGRVLITADEDIDDSPYLKALKNTDFEYVKKWLGGIM